MNAPHLPGKTSLPVTGLLATAEVMAIFQPLAEEQVQDFGSSVDQELARLEERFAHFKTVKSIRRSFGR